MAEKKLLTLNKQIATCGVLLILGVAITCLFQTRPLFSEWMVGIALWQQSVVALGFGALAMIGAEIAFRITYFRRVMVLPPAMQNIDLSGSAPLVISLAAGVSEEILFRAALQPLIGIWFASAVFAVAHLRTASVAGSPLKKVIYLANVFVVGLALGLVFQRIGLLTVILVHAIIDFVALRSMRRLQLLNRTAHVNQAP
jgi:membrane protease YdiL (CAAX protease family)